MIAPSLTRLLRERPLTIAEYMHWALFAREGYYRETQPIGMDFITAPEISQMFGEMLGLWAVDGWQKMGSPSPFLLVELGPGRGTLMADFLRAAKGAAPDFIQALQLHLIEVNSSLKREQQKLLSEYHPLHHDNIAALPDGPVIVIANEFFDCLPIHQFQNTQGNWQERGVALRGEHLDFVLLPPSPLASLLNHSKPFIETSPMSLALMHHLAKRFESETGIALIIDYGYVEENHGNTLQAMKNFERISPLEKAGTADLTAHVDFAALKKAAEEAGAKVAGPITQGAFLKNLGIEYRARQLGGEEAALDRLIGPREMGNLFKVLGVTSSTIEPLAGFHA